jgi:hypothetical protein
MLPPRRTGHLRNPGRLIDGQAGSGEVGSVRRPRRRDNRAAALHLLNPLDRVL